MWSRTWTFQFLIVVVVGVVFKVSSLDKIQQRFVEQITSTIQSRVLVVSSFRPFCLILAHTWCRG